MSGTLLREMVSDFSPPCSPPTIKSHSATFLNVPGLPIRTGYHRPHTLSLADYASAQGSNRSISPSNSVPLPRPASTSSSLPPPRPASPSRSLPLPLPSSASTAPSGLTNGAQLTDCSGTLLQEMFSDFSPQCSPPTIKSHSMTLNHLPGFPTRSGYQRSHSSLPPYAGSCSAHNSDSDGDSEAAVANAIAGAQGFGSGLMRRNMSCQQWTSPSTDSLRCIADVERFFSETLPAPSPAMERTSVCALLSGAGIGLRWGGVARLHTGCAFRKL